MDPQIDAETLARPYDDGYHDDNWEIVEQYLEVTCSKWKYPDKGSSAIARSSDDVRSSTTSTSRKLPMNRDDSTIRSVRRIERPDYRRSPALGRPTFPAPQNREQRSDESATRGFTSGSKGTTPEMQFDDGGTERVRTDVPSMLPSDHFGRTGPIASEALDYLEMDNLTRGGKSARLRPVATRRR
ncbi:hypothetical protein [Halovivax sp.]|uniref:hypothetical protein n=1 Tax=Halovivax sp. TaxID=1935978 RepID=UPI0025BBB4E8|nr:hypothetical protein [Halovivax sp.]